MIVIHELNELYFFYFRYFRYELNRGICKLLHSIADSDFSGDERQHFAVVINSTDRSYKRRETFQL